HPISTLLFYCDRAHTHLHSSPTRRSSDLTRFHEPRPHLTCSFIIARIRLFSHISWSSFISSNSAYLRIIEGISPLFYVNGGHHPPGEMVKMKDHIEPV